VEEHLDQNHSYAPPVLTPLDLGNPACTDGREWTLSCGEQAPSSGTGKAESCSSTSTSRRQYRGKQSDLTHGYHMFG